MSKPRGIFCLEGGWSDSLTDRTTIEPQLRMLENMREADVIHRDVATREELAYYLVKWSQKKYVSYSLAYLAFHGRSGRLDLGRDEVTLAELAEIAGPRLDGRTVYFGSCSVMAANDQELMAFCRDTGAKAVVGYTKVIDFLEAAAFDFILLPKLLNATFVKPILPGLRRDHERFVVGLGLRIATKAWCTDRKLALDAAPGS